MSGSTTQHTETTGRPQPTRNTGQKIAYAFGNLGQAAFYNTMSTFFITFVTTAGDNERALALLPALGFPFKQK